MLKNYDLTIGQRVEIIPEVFVANDGNTWKGFRITAGGRGWTGRQVYVLQDSNARIFGTIIDIDDRRGQSKLPGWSGWCEFGYYIRPNKSTKSLKVIDYALRPYVSKTTGIANPNIADYNEFRTLDKTYGCLGGNMVIEPKYNKIVQNKG